MTLSPPAGFAVIDPETGPILSLVPVYRDEANAWIRRVHRHHGPTLGYRFALGASGPAGLCGVAVGGRPVARCYDDGRTLEVTRLATDGTRNAGSFLYGAMRRAAVALGYDRIITYTLPAESGASLKGAGYRLVRATKGGQWDCPSRPRQLSLLSAPKLLWQAGPRSL